MEQTPDGGYILAGVSSSEASFEKSQDAKGETDYWIVKVDAHGRKQWDRTVGGGGSEYVSSLRLTADGGYLVGGTSDSNIGGDKTQASRGSGDYWIVKLDAQGNTQWDRTFGGDAQDALLEAWPTSDGGYILGGHSYSGLSGDKSQAGRATGGRDYWLIKLDATGTKQWDRTYGTVGDDELSALSLTTDGGYIVGGSSFSGISGDKSHPSRGNADYWVLKLTAKGDKQWDACFGGSDTETLSAVQQTPDGGYILGGSSRSGVSGDKSEPGFGGWVVKLDAAGTKQWDHAITSSLGYMNGILDLHQTRDGGYIVGGKALVTHPVFPERGQWDYWIAKLDKQGLRQWDRTYGGTYDESLHTVRQTTDGGYVLGGWSISERGADKSEPSRGLSDYWLLKLESPTIQGSATVCVGGQTTLTAPASAEQYTWSTGATTPSITVTQPGTYSVHCSKADGTSYTLEHAVDRFVPPQPVITVTSPLCSDVRGSLTVTAPGARSFQWNTGATTASITVTEPGSYSVVALFGDACSSHTQTQIWVPAVIPVLSLGADTTLCEGEEIVLQAPSLPAGTTYRWSDGSTASTLRVHATGTYSLVVSTVCEERTVSRRIGYTNCLFVPNVVTANGDGHNDYFAPAGLVGTDWQLTIYNRWGREVYQTASYRNDWGAAAAAGTYFYVLSHAATKKQYKGTIEVIR